MTSDQRFGLILLGLGILGWFIRNLITGMRADTEANTIALNELARELERFRLQVAEQNATEARAEAAELRAAVAASKQHRRRLLRRL